MSTNRKPKPYAVKGLSVASLLALAGAVACTCAVVALPARAAKPKRTPEEIKQQNEQLKEQRAKLNRLQSQAMGADPAATSAAFRELEGLGDQGKATIIDTIQKILAREKTKLDAAARPAGDAKAAKAAEKAMEDALTAERAAARQHLAKLTNEPESLKQAKAHFDKLLALYTKLDRVYANRATAFEVVAKRAELHETWDRLNLMSPQNPFDASADAQHDKVVRQVAGFPLKRVAQLVAQQPSTPGAAPAEPAAETAAASTPAAAGASPTTAPSASAATQPAAAPVTQPAGAQDEPVEVDLRAAWRYWMHRRADNWHKSQKMVFDTMEVDALRLMNQYRELLGIPPLEGDPRLAQAARAHAKEMYEMKYVSHTGMDKEAREPHQRAQKAGWQNPAIAESLAPNAASGQAAFQTLFNTPEDHQHMVNPGFTAAGVGKWNERWAVLYGTGDRLLLASEQARSSIAASGNAVQPQSAIRAAAAAEAAAKRAQEAAAKRQQSQAK